MTEKNWKNRMFSRCIPKKSIILGVLDPFLAVIRQNRGPYRQAKVPLFFHKLYYNIQLYFLCKQSQKLDVHCMYTQKSLISAIFDLFWEVFGHIRGPYGQAKGPFYFQILYFNIQLYFHWKKCRKLDDNQVYTLKILHFRRFWPILGSFFCNIFVVPNLQAQNHPGTLK